VTVKPAARGGHRGAGVRSTNGTGARWRVIALSCLMLSEACGGLSLAPGRNIEQRHDRRRWAAPDADAEAWRRRRNALGPTLVLSSRRWKQGRFVAGDDGQ
jgi:hypothetical protein